MREVRCRTVWISDVHLGTRECAADALLAFLDRHDCEYLYLVGDIVDFWQLGRTPYWPQIQTDVVREVLSKARAGTIVTIIPGNHDEYLRRFCDLQLGNIMITREAIHRTADGRLLLVLHGDEFEGMGASRILARVADVGYSLMVRINRWINRGRRLLGYGYCNLSASLTALLQSASRFVAPFETAVVHEAARRRVAGVSRARIVGPRGRRPERDHARGRRVSLVALAIAAVLLAAERACYVLIARRPDLFLALYARLDPARRSSAVTVVARLFFAFKALQFGVFIAWCHVHGGHFPWPAPHDPCVGTVLTIWGGFMLVRFPHDDWWALPLLETVYYLGGMWLETSRRRYGARYASITFKIRSRAARLTEGSERSRPT